MWKIDSLKTCFVFCKLKKTQNSYNWIWNLRAPYCLWKKGWAEQEMKMGGEDVCGHKMPSKGTQQFSTFLTTRNVFFLHFSFSMADHYTVRWEKKIKINLLIFSHINSDDTTNSHCYFWEKKFSNYFQENCPTPFALQSARPQVCRRRGHCCG